MVVHNKTSFFGGLKSSELMWLPHWSASTLKPLIADVNNNDHLITMQSSAAKSWVPASKLNTTWHTHLIQTSYWTKYGWVDWFSKFCRCQSGQASAGSNGTRTIHGGLTRQHAGPKRSATNILSSDTTGHLCYDHALTAQSCFGCARGTCIILTRWFNCCSWLVYNPNYWHWQVSSYSFRLSLFLYGQKYKKLPENEVKSILFIKQQSTANVISWHFSTGEGLDPTFPSMSKQLAAVAENSGQTWTHGNGSSALTGSINNSNW